MFGTLAWSSHNNAGGDDDDDADDDAADDGVRRGTTTTKTTERYTIGRSVRRSAGLKKKGTMDMKSTHVAVYTVGHQGMGKSPTSRPAV